MRLALFDCDGTLVDSAGLIHTVMQRTFVAFNHRSPDLAATKSIIGLTLDIAIARLQGKAHVDEEALAMTAHYKSIFADIRREQGGEPPLFDRIAKVVAELAQRQDVVLGAVTGKSRRGLLQVLEAHGLTTQFMVSRTADDCPSKPHPAMVTECCAEAGIAPADTVVIGDAVYDMQMAKAAGAMALGVSWGYAPMDALHEAGADAIATRASDILNLFKEVVHA